MAAHFRQLVEIRLKDRVSVLVARRRVSARRLPFCDFQIQHSNTVKHGEQEKRDEGWHDKPEQL